MKFKHKHPPKEGSLRIIKKFLILPTFLESTKEIMGETRWLETAYLLQEYENNGLFEYRWVSKKYIDIDDVKMNSLNEMFKSTNREDFNTAEEIVQYCSKPTKVARAVRSMKPRKPIP